MSAVARTPVLLAKPIEFAASAAFNEMYGGIEAALYVRMALAILRKYPYDMLVFEMADENHLQVRLAGYNLETQVKDEETVVFRTQSLETKKFWLKIDDYGDKYVATFLFPEDY